MAVQRNKPIKQRPRSIISSMTSANRKDQHALTKSYQYCHKVINTAELLEMILLAFFTSENADVAAQKALLKIQEVSRVFQDAVKSSVKLQRNLCFLPDPSKRLYSGEPFVAPLHLPYESSKIHRPIFSFVYNSSSSPFRPSSGAAFAIKITEKRLAPKEAESWQKMLVMQNAKDVYWVTVARLPFLGLIPKHSVDVKCGPDTTAGELMRLAREKFWNNGIRDIDVGREGRETAGGRENNAIVL